MEESVRDEDRRIALVTGGSRGLGAATVKALLGTGYDVLFTYYNKTKRATQVLRQVDRRGGDVWALASDMTVAEDQQALIRALAEWGGNRLDLLVLNAAGGLEPERANDPGYPMRMNCAAQVELVERTLPLMSAGGTIVYITSHWAHLYGQIRQLPWYEAVAESKYAGERDLRAMLAGSHVRLLVASGDIIEDTIMTHRLEKLAPIIITSRRTLLGALPSVDEAGAAVARAASDPSLASGSIVIIGGSLESVIETFGSA